MPTGDGRLQFKRASRTSSFLNRQIWISRNGAMSRPVTITSLINPRIACWYGRRTRDRKVASSNPGFSSVNFVCGLLFGVCLTPVLSQ